MYTACVKRITHRWATQQALDSALVASSVVQQPWHSPPPLAWLVASRYRPDNSTTYDTNNTSSHCMTCIKNTRSTYHAVGYHLHACTGTLQGVATAITKAMKTIAARQQEKKRRGYRATSVHKMKRSRTAIRWAAS